uniref:Envelope-like protein n=1 Tax=Loa loa TaxID=7209 RepID=A0A1I7VMA7_LOALO
MAPCPQTVVPVAPISLIPFALRTSGCNAIREQGSDSAPVQTIAFTIINCRSNNTCNKVTTIEELDVTSLGLQTALQKRNTPCRGGREACSGCELCWRWLISPVGPPVLDRSQLKDQTKCSTDRLGSLASRQPSWEDEKTLADGAGLILIPNTASVENTVPAGSVLVTNGINVIRQVLHPLALRLSFTLSPLFHKFIDISRFEALPFDGKCSLEDELDLIRDRIHYLCEGTKDLMESVEDVKTELRNAI